MLTGPMGVWCAQVSTLRGAVHLQGEHSYGERYTPSNTVLWHCDRKYPGPEIGESETGDWRQFGLSSLPVFLPVLRALRVLCLVLYSWPPFYFLSSFLTNFIDTYVTVLIDERITLLICLDSFPIRIFLSIIPAHVYLNMFKHFHPLPFSYTYHHIHMYVLCCVLHWQPPFCLHFPFSTNY